MHTRQQNIQTKMGWKSIGWMDRWRSSGSTWSGPRLSEGHCPEANASFPVEARLPHSHIVSAPADSTSQRMGPTVDLSCLSKIKETCNSNVT